MNPSISTISLFSEMYLEALNACYLLQTLQC